MELLDFGRYMGFGGIFLFIEISVLIGMFGGGVFFGMGMRVDDGGFDNVVYGG